MNAVVLGAEEAGTAPNSEATIANTAPRAKPLVFVVLDICLFLLGLLASKFPASPKAHRPPTKQEIKYTFAIRLAQEQRIRYGNSSESLRVLSRLPA